MQDFFRALFDFSFRKYITPKVAGAVYGLAIVMGAAQGLVVIATLGAKGLILGPLMFLAIVISARVAIEVSLSIFQIARYSAEIARQGRKNQGLTQDGEP